MVDQNGRGGSDTITDQNPIRNDTTKQRESYKKAEWWDADYITLKDGKKIAEYSKEEVQADIDFLRDYLERNSDQ